MLIRRVARKALLPLGALVSLAGGGCGPLPAVGISTSPCTVLTGLLDQGDVEAATELLASHQITDVTIPRQVAAEFVLGSINCGTRSTGDDPESITSVFFSLYDREGEYVGAWAYVTEDPAVASDTHLQSRLGRLNDVDNEVVDVSTRERVAFHERDAESYARQGRANDDTEMSVLSAFVEDQLG